MHTARIAVFSAAPSFATRIGISIGLASLVAAAIARTGMLRAAAQRLRRALAIVPSDEAMPFTCSLD